MKVGVRIEESKLLAFEMYDLIFLTDFVDAVWVTSL